MPEVTQPPAARPCPPHPSPGLPLRSPGPVLGVGRGSISAPGLSGLTSPAHTQAPRLPALHAPASPHLLDVALTCSGCSHSWGRLTTHPVSDTKIHEQNGCPREGRHGTENVCPQAAPYLQEGDRRERRQQPSRPWRPVARVQGPPCGVCGVLPDPSPFSPGVWGEGGGPAVALASGIWEAAERGQISVASPDGRGLPQAPGPCLPRTPRLGSSALQVQLLQGRSGGGVLLWTLRPSWERGWGHFHEVSGGGGQSKVLQTEGPGAGDRWEADAGGPEAKAGQTLTGRPRASGQGDLWVVQAATQGSLSLRSQNLVHF